MFILGMGISSLMIALLIGIRSTVMRNMAGGALGTSKGAATHSAVRTGRTRFSPSSPAHVSDKNVCFWGGYRRALLGTGVTPSFSGMRMGSILQGGRPVSFEEKIERYSFIRYSTGASVLLGI